MTVDHHTLALISIIGSSLDVLGALYLAYDILGGEHGPLRTLTRAVTYGLLFGTGYGIGLGFIFGLASGIAHGITLGWELSRASRHKPKSGFWLDTGMSAIRGVGFALGASYLYGPVFGITFGLMSTAGQAIGYRLGISPAADYRPARQLRITGFQMLAAANRAVGYAVTAYVCSLIAGQQEHAIAVGLTVGLTMGLVTGIAGAFMPFVEWTADHVPERRMGVVGVGLILIGFTLQSVQYWAMLLDVMVR